MHFSPRSLRTRRLLPTLIVTVVALAVGCGDDSVTPTPGPGGGEPDIGATSFVSADATLGQPSRDDAGGPGGGDSANDGEEPSSGEGDGGGAQVEEGDIYRMLGPGTLLNLNSYRGVQVIDLSDPDSPEIVAQVQVSGSPVELYAMGGDRAVVLLNGWRGYYGARDDVMPEAFEGGVVVSVDLSDQRAPVVTDRVRVPGYIRTSRLVREGDSAAVYVVSQLWGEGTKVRSFALGDGGALDPAGELDLGGDVADIQATPGVLLVARNDWEDGRQRSRVAIIDIGDASGAMELGGEVQTRGYVRKKTDMDVHGDILRVVTAGPWWWEREPGDEEPGEEEEERGPGNHLETFDISDRANPEPLDHAVFGEEQDLFATLFLGNKAFFVTYRRVDPFHAFAIGDDGSVEEKAEFVISGWNDWFKPVFADSRLIGIGTNDEEGRTMAVSLYDITDLSNPEPFIARAETDTAWSWSEASWDDRAFSVIEDGVSVQAEGDVEETGLVLLPFTGWDPEGERHLAAVQIFTFSETTLTRRGLMDHGTPVRRTFEAADGLAANLSEERLSLFECSDPDAPEALGAVELAPDYADFLAFGDSGVRLQDGRAGWWWGRWEGEGSAPNTQLHVVSLDDHPDRAAPLATLEAPPGAGIHKVGDLLVSVAARPMSKEVVDEFTLETKIEVFDLSDPAAASKVGELNTTDLPRSWGGWGWGWDHGGPEDMGGGGDAVGPPSTGAPEPAPDESTDDAGDFETDESNLEEEMPWWDAWGYEAFAVDGALVLAERRPQQESVGTERVCWEHVTDESHGEWSCWRGDVVEPGPGGDPTEPDEPGEPSDGGDPGEEPGEEPDEPDRPDDEDQDEDGDKLDEPCEFWTGGVTCRALDGADEVCQGGFDRCVRDVDGEVTCEEGEPPEGSTDRNCDEWERFRWWQQLVLHVIDVTDPTAPTLRDPVELDDSWEAGSVIEAGGQLYASGKRPAEVEGDAREFVRYEFVRVDLAAPAAPVVHEPVNVPGEVIAVTDDGATLFTRDVMWGDRIVETAVNRLAFDADAGMAELQARRRFEDRFVRTVLSDGAGHLLVSHGPGQDMWGGGGVVDDGVAVGGGGGVAVEGDVGAPAVPGDSAGSSESSEQALEHDDDLTIVTVLDAASQTFDVLSETPVDRWADLREAASARALFQVPGGLLVLSLDDPASPEATAWFPLRGWPRRTLIESGAAYVPAGRFGVYRFDLDERNLLPAPAD